MSKKWNIHSHNFLLTLAEAFYSFSTNWNCLWQSYEHLIWSFDFLISDFYILYLIFKKSLQYKNSRNIILPKCKYLLLLLILELFRYINHLLTFWHWQWIFFDFECYCTRANIFSNLMAVTIKNRILIWTQIIVQ